MPWLTQDATDFLAELALHNDRGWFAANKKRYETSVKGPMEALAAALIDRMRQIDPGIQMLPKEAVFRIHRDTRFSKDKTPYKTNAGLAISSGGKSAPGITGVYVHVDPGSFGIASGYYFLEPPQIERIRRHIAENLEEFQSRLEDAEFVRVFGTIQGEANKILPPNLREAAAKQPLLFKKQFYYWVEFDPETALREDLPDFVMEHVRAAWPMNEFLKRGLDA